MNKNELFLYDIYDGIGGIAFSDAVVEQALKRLDGKNRDLFLQLVSDTDEVKLLMNPDPDFEVSRELKEFLKTVAFIRARNCLLLAHLEEKKSELSQSVMARAVCAYLEGIKSWETGYCDLFELKDKESEFFRLYKKLSPDDKALRSLLEVLLLYNEDVFDTDRVLKLYLDVKWSIKNLE